MKVRIIKLQRKRRQIAYHQWFRKHYFEIPTLGSTGESVSLMEDRACYYELEKFYKTLALRDGWSIQAADDDLAPLIPAKAWLGVDKSAKVFQGNSVYVTKPLPQYDRGPGSLGIARIVHDDTGYTYYYDNDTPIHFDDLKTITILGRVIAVCPKGFFSPKVTRI